MINVTKSYLPPKQEFLKYIDSIWGNHILTNDGPLLKLFENKLKEFTGCDQLLICANGTIVLQMALRAMKITKEVITTPFTYVATTNALLWEGCKPVFSDINKKDFTINADKIEHLITKDTEAILATHVYGIPCDVEKIEKIALKHNLKVVYDGAHAFGTTYKGKSIFNFGDITTCSFHATKLFNSAEGGALFINNSKYFDQLSLYRSFGHIYDEYISVGINAKMSELHAGLGLSILDHVPEIIIKRKKASLLYDKYLNNKKFEIPSGVNYNYAYYPVLFKSEKLLLSIIKQLGEYNIFPRRYFYPSLNKLPFLKNAQSCPVSETISRRVLCLPLSYYLTDKEIKKICNIINQS